ncbi:hypothetical protein [Deminuibacter soli]|uniref:Uncharacterized protein n=1 Tax=Deminuibacter soli TaxID=2291815 RepID=A0A3E1NMI0_9BACT|nr:hypothetical protein [Deminuibacter soli]RFM29107.1 hypothetical protein DXN05_10160 [Deminuibacter soli]
MEEKQILNALLSIYQSSANVSNMAADSLSMGNIIKDLKDGEDRWNHLVTVLRDAGLHVDDAQYLIPGQSPARSLTITLDDEPKDGAYLAFHLSSLTPLFFFYINRYPRIDKEFEQSFLVKHKEELVQADPIERPNVIRKIFLEKYGIEFKSSQLEADDAASEQVVDTLIKALKSIYPEYALISKDIVFKPVPELQYVNLKAPTFFDLLFDDSHRYLKIYSN